MRQLSFKDITDHHLRLMLEGQEYSVDATPSDWINEIAQGRIELWESEDWLLGIRRLPDCLFLEFIFGSGLKSDPEGFMRYARTLARGKPIELATKRMGMVRLASRNGFELSRVYMRAE